MGRKKQLPKPLPVEPMPPTPSDRLYFEARKTVLDRELHDATAERDFGRAFKTLLSYGEFLEKYPQADAPTE